MSDTATRPSPYALVFGASLFEEEHFPGIARAEQAFGVAHDAAQFIALDAGEALLQAVLPAEALGPAAAPGRAPGGASAFVVDRYAALLFAAYRFWQAGRLEYRVDEAVTRSLLEAPPAIGAAWSLAAAPAAGYVQLPKHLVWATAAAGDPAEPVDGFFWVRTSGAEPRLTVVLALGVRADRPGFSVVDTSEAIPDEGHFADRATRPGGVDFANFLPGGALGELHGVQTTGEVLRLASLCLWHVTRARAGPPADTAGERPRADG